MYHRRAEDKIKLVLIYFLLPLILLVVWIDFLITGGKDPDNDVY